MFKLDLNERERRRFAEVFKNISEQSAKLQASLENNDEEKVVIEFIFLSLLLSGGVSEFQKLVVDVMKAAKDAPEFPDFIGG